MIVVFFYLGSVCLFCFYCVFLVYILLSVLSCQYQCSASLRNDLLRVKQDVKILTHSITEATITLIRVLMILVLQRSAGK